MTKQTNEGPPPPYLPLGSPIGKERPPQLNNKVTGARSGSTEVLMDDNGKEKDAGGASVDGQEGVEDTQIPHPLVTYLIETQDYESDDDDEDHCYHGGYMSSMEDLCFGNQHDLQRTRYVRLADWLLDHPTNSRMDLPAPSSSMCNELFSSVPSTTSNSMSCVSWPNDSNLLLGIGDWVMVDEVEEDLDWSELNYEEGEGQ